MVGQHPFREVIRCRPLPTTGRKRLHRRHRRIGSGIESPAQAHEERRVGRAGGPSHASLLRRGNPRTHLSDVRLPHSNRARHRRRPGIRSPIIRGRLHTFGFLPSLHLYRAFARRQTSRTVRRDVISATPGYIRKQRYQFHGRHRHRPRRIWRSA